MCFVCNKKKGKHPFLTNKRGLKQIWVPKDKIVFVANILNNRVTTPIIVPGQWILTSHYGRKTYVPRTEVLRWLVHWFLRKPEEDNKRYWLCRTEAQNKSQEVASGSIPVTVYDTAFIDVFGEAYSKSGTASVDASGDQTKPEAYAIT